MDEIYEEEYGGGVEYLPERAAYDRVSRGRLEDAVSKFLGSAQAVGSLTGLTRMAMRFAIDDQTKISQLLPPAQFYLRDTLGITELGSDASLVELVQDRLSYVPNIRYKSPSGLLLGYLVLDTARKKINKELLAKISKKLERDPSLKGEDVLRYARLWQRVLR